MSSVPERRVHPDVAALRFRWAAAFHSKGAALAGITLLGVFWGFAVATVDLNALYLAASLIGCIFVLRDFRVGVVLLILLMPISSTSMFPRTMLGIMGLSPVNLLVAATLGSYLLRGLFDGSIRHFAPRPLLWLYVIPIIAAGTMGVFHVDEIAPLLLMNKKFEMTSVAAYINMQIVYPLLMVVFALLVGAAASRSENPERFFVPTWIAMWITASIVIVFVLQSGIGLGELASSASREFLSPLGLHANEWGRLYAFAYALLLFTWAETKRLGQKTALLASMAWVVVALVLTFSRGSFLGFIMVNVLFLLWRRNARALIFFGLFAAVALFAMPEAVYDRVATGLGGRSESEFEGGPDAMSAGRIDFIWLPLLPEVLRSPIFGHGLGSIVWSEAMHRGAGVTIAAVGHPHNAYLQLLLDMGIVGLIVVCAYFVHVWKGLRALSVDPALSPRMRGFYLGAAAGLASLALSYVTDSSLLPKAEQVFMWLAIGMMYGERARRKVESAS